MARGGARNRSGPSLDPSSGRSDQRGISLQALPAGGFTGEVPEFPLPRVTRYEWEFDEGKKYRIPSESLTESYRVREIAVWAEAWMTPQAVAWVRESWRWPVIAEYCRLKTVVELEPDANASLVGQLHRFRDQIGLTPAGLKENGWAIAADEVAVKRGEKSEPAQPVRRLRAVDGR